MSSSASHPPSREGRRSPRPAERQRDPERTKARILDAAAQELSDKGIAAVRVGAIADRAGVNKQLISYYFGGKDGLLRALGEQWRVRKDALNDPALTLPQLVEGFVRAAMNDPAATRLLGWEGLTYSQPGADPEAGARSRQARDDIADISRRQREGELAADLDPAQFFLAVMGAAVAPVLLPHVAYGLVGEEADSPEFPQQYARELSRMVAHLAERTTLSDSHED